jgi:uncharacterized protein YecE (DUF72 family)
LPETRRLYARGTKSATRRAASSTAHVTGRACVGTSGWNYKGWQAGFYAGIPQKDWLRYSAGRFSGLEVNASFYRLQSPSTLERWYEQTPTGFCFALKGHRFLTHNKKLLGAEESLALQRESTAGLKDKLAVVLWQLPREFKKNLARLQSFTAALAGWSNVRHALEFRNPSWFDDEVADCLISHRLAVALSDAASWPMWDHVTTDLVYVRLHGRPNTYASAYSETELDHWAERTSGWLAEGRDVHVYFDNDAEGAAPFDALNLLARLETQS